MSLTVNVDDLIAKDLSLLCRGCLATTGEMKHMVEWGLVDDFCRLTNVQVNKLDNPSLLLCTKCEDVLYKCRGFRLICQQSDMLLRCALEKRLDKEASNTSSGATAYYPKENVLYSELGDNRLVIKISAPNAEEKIYLPCPYQCKTTFLKRTGLLHHLVNRHKIEGDFNIDLQYYCPVTDCPYHVNSGKNKRFAGRKNLNQHTYKVHGVKINCDSCELPFASDVDYKRHLKTCSYVYVCQVCEVQFRTNEKLMIHLLRKHPELHKQYKSERKAEKRRQELSLDAKKSKTDAEKTEFFCDSPKRSFATQTLDVEKHIRNDVTLPPWHAEKSDETKKDETSTQTVFEDLLSLKSNISEEDTIFSDAVSLTDIQTQTVPLEFGLSRSNKETITSETQSPDLSIKETQTCLCLYETKPNFKCTDSMSSSPGSAFNMLTSTETQTLDLRGGIYSDFLSFTSAETQTCFEDDSNKNL